MRARIPAKLETVLLCPVRDCHLALVREERRLFCARGHSFDVARSGYINLLQPQDRRSKQPGDTAAAVAGRRRLHDRGITAPLLRSIAELARAQATDVVLDAGCGDGFYLGSLAGGSGFDAHDIGPGVIFDRDGLKITAFEVEHMPIDVATGQRLKFADVSDFYGQTLGYRIDYKGHSVLFSGDTRSTDASRIPIEGKGVDVLVHEVQVPSKGGSKEARLAKEKASVVTAVEAAQQVLEQGQTIFASGLDREPLRELHLMTAKPFLYVFNLDPDEIANAAVTDELRALVAPAEAIFLDAKTESELIELDPAEALELLQSMGQEESGIDQLARVGFATLGLQTYLTAGPKEARAWTIPVGATAPQAAGEIHTDFEKGFIRAETIAYDDYVRLNGEAGARDAGKLRSEGKDYVVKDGDVMHFRFNV